MIAGMLILAFGVNLMVTANVIMNSGEAFVQAVVIKTKRNFGKTKIVFDSSLVAAALILSLIFFHRPVAVREGTLIAAAATGFIVNFYAKFSHPLVKWFLR